jgi:hypothetical protein
MLKDVVQARFDEFIFQHDEYITVQTATILARELGVSFEAESYDF